MLLYFLLVLERKANGEVSEWFKELVLKTSDSARGRGFESYLLRFFSLKYVIQLEKYPSG